MANCVSLPVVRDVQSRVAVADGLWSEPLNAARLWNAHGAPDREIARMWAEDYGFDVTEDCVRKLLTGFVDERPTGNREGRRHNR